MVWDLINSLMNLFLLKCKRALCDEAYYNGLVTVVYTNIPIIKIFSKIIYRFLGVADDHYPFSRFIIHFYHTSAIL